MQFLRKVKLIKYGRNLRSFLAKYSLSYNLIDNIIIFFKISLYPLEFFLRKFFYLKTILINKEIINISKNDSFFQTNISRFGSKNLVDDCNLIYDKFKKKKKI